MILALGLIGAYFLGAYVTHMGLRSYNLHQVRKGRPSNVWTETMGPIVAWPLFLLMGACVFPFSWLNEKLESEGRQMLNAANRREKLLKEAADMIEGVEKEPDESKAKEELYRRSRAFVTEMKSENKVLRDAIQRHARGLP